MEKSVSLGSVARLLLSVFFFCYGAFIGSIAVFRLWELYARHQPQGAHDWVFHFPLFRLYEPWSCGFALACSFSFVWAGCSLLGKRDPFRVGAVVGTICLIVLSLVAVVY
jgi:hypothetical protein